MTALESTAELPVKELITDMVQTLKVEYDLLVEESGRVNTILGEAAVKLRRGFRQMDETVRDSVDLDFVSKNGHDYDSAYGEIISALQFEDIVSQIVAHQVNRALATQEILVRMGKLLEGEPGAPVIISAEEVLRLKADIGASLARCAQSSSVRQENLNVGDTELF